MKRNGRVQVGFTSRFVVVALILVLAGAVVARHPGGANATGISNITEYSTPGGDPWGTAFDASGRVWVALPGCDLAPSCPKSTKPGKLGLFDPNTSTWSVVVSLPPGFGQPLFVAVDRVGKVWFTMPVTNTIGVYDSATATVRQWAVPTAGSGPWGVTIDSNGKIWFTEHYGNKIGAFDPSTETFQEVATPASNSNPYGITTDAGNNIWFTENNDAVARIAEYTSGGVLKEFKIRNTSTAGTGLTPHQITVDSLGNVWWSEGWVSSIGRLNVALAQPGTNLGVTEYHYTPSCGGCGSHTSGIATDGNGLIWLDDALQNTFGSFPMQGGAFSFYASPSGGHPHDGLNVDSQNRVWYDEEFANKLAKATQSSSTTTTTTATSTTTSGTTTTTVPASTTSTTLPGAGTVLATDTFSRPDQAGWGTASDGHVWGGDASNGTVFSISGHTGRVANTGSASFSAVLGTSAPDAEAFAAGSMSTFASSNFGDVLRWTDGNNWYKAFIDGTQLFIQKKVAGVTTMLGSTPFAATGGTAYTIHFRVVGSTLTASVWPTSGSEPAGWMLTVADSSLTSGFAGLRFLTPGSTATISSFTADVPGGSTTTTTTSTTTPPTSTTTSGSTTSVPTSTSTTQPGSGTVLGTDTFQRADQPAWGIASDGQAWGGDATNGAVFSISLGTGRVTNTGSTSYSAVLGPASTNAEVFAAGSMSVFASSNFGDVLRWTNGNNWYKAFIDGSQLFIQKKVAGVTTMLGSTPFAATAGISYTIHFRVVGSTLTANVWPTSGSEPSGWMLTATDSTLTSGFAGLRFLTQGGSSTISSYRASSL